MYNLFYQFDSSSDNDTLPISELRDHYFVYTNSDSIGIDYDKYKKVINRKVTIDSLFKFEWIAQNKLYPIFTVNSTQLLSSEFNDKTGILKETYSFRGKKDSTINGTLFLDFTNNLKGIHVSLSKELDSIKNMKLFKVRVISNARRMTDGIYLDKFEQTHDLNEVPVLNREEVMSYFERYKKDFLSSK